MKSFENDGVRLDMGSGYVRGLHRKAPLYPQMSYWIVVKDGIPVDLVRENPSGKTNVSIIDSIKEKERTGRPKHVPSSYWPRRTEAGLRFVEISNMELHNVLGNPVEMAKFRKVRIPSKPRATHSDNIKRLVIEARSAGDTWGAISKRYGVPKGTARRWCEGVRKGVPQATLQGTCAQPSETRIDTGLKSANSDDHRVVSGHMEVSK